MNFFKPHPRLGLRLRRHLKPWVSAMFAAGLLAAAWPAVAQNLKPVSVARGLVNPWALAFLPDGRMLVTERPGRMRVIGADGRLGEPLQGLPPVVARGQCGLLDVVVDPKFADNRLVYWTFAEPGEDGTNGTSVARGRLEGNALTNVQVIFRQTPKVNSQLHCGSRLVFGRDGNLFVALGDRFGQMAQAQVTGNSIGKVMRITPEGKAPADNPSVGRSEALPELFSIGHRNIQAAALNPGSGELWAAEHGPQGGDELNVVLPGRNYGWPVVTYGRNYGTGTRIGEEGPKPGIEMPIRHWVPTSVAPSGLAFITGNRYPGWEGSLVMGTLREQALIRFTLDGRKVAAEQSLLPGFNQRIRDVRQGPDGWLYIVTDSGDGQVFRLER
jgi:aldose sugar dehydrogenase